MSEHERFLAALKRREAVERFFDAAFYVLGTAGCCLFLYRVLSALERCGS